MIRTPVPFNASLPSVLITGANRGIGLSLAKVFHANQYNVIGTSRLTSEPDTIAELSKVSTAVVPLDLTNESDIARLPSVIDSITPSLNVLINNAGMVAKDEIGALTKKSMLDHFITNSIAPILVTQALLPLLRDKAGKVVQISSLLGSIGENFSGGYYAYRCSKAALNMGNMSLARDAKEVTFLTVHPGYVQTRMTGNKGDIDSTTCASSLFDIITKSTLADSGKFLSYNGSELKW